MEGSLEFDGVDEAFAAAGASFWDSQDAATERNAAAAAADADTAISVRMDTIPFPRVHHIANARSLSYVTPCD